MIEIKNYSEKELKYIQDNYTNKTNKEIADYLHKSINSIKYVANKLGLLKQPHKPWTKDEDQYLIDHYIDLTSEQIAQHLGRTVNSINTRRDDLKLIRHENWTNEEISYIKENYLEMTHSEMGNHLGRSEGAIRAKCFDLNLYKKEVPWEDWELEFVRNNCMTMTRKEISEYLNRSPNAIQVKAARMGFKKYPYYCDYHYFDKIDTEEKAYWLGFISADGWINKNNKNNAGVVGIELQYNDINHLKKFNKSIGGNYKITDRWRTCSLSKSSKLNHMCNIRIFSIVMYEALIKLGFTSNKTYDLGFPNIPHDLYRHFLRGNFDGDGCISVSNNRLSVSFCTVSKEFKDDIIKLANDENIIMHDYSFVDENNIIVYRPEATKNSEKIKLLDYMYKDATIYLDRKYKKYLKAKAKYSTTDGLAAQK